MSESLYQDNLDHFKDYINKNKINIHENSDKEPFLHQAVSNGATTIIEYLLQQESEVNKQNKQGFTPIALAAYRGDLKVIRSLLTNNADPNIPNKWGNTPLHNVADSKKCVEKLLAANADVATRNNKLETPLDTATEANKNTIIPLLRESLYGGESTENKKMTVDDIKSCVIL